MSLFKKKSAAEPDTQPDKPGNNKLLLFIFILLLAVFGYLYFFTSLIVPHEAPKTGAPLPPPQVKQAMPPRGAEVAAPPAGEVKSQQEVKPQTPLPPPAQTAAKTPAPPVPLPVQPAVKSPAPAAQAKVEAKPAPPAKKEEQKPSVATENKSAVKTPAKDVKPSPSPAVTGVKDKNPAKAEKAPAVGVVKKRGELFILNLGEFAVGSQTTAVLQKLDKLKIRPVFKKQTQKISQMNRLFYNSYSEYETYSAELEKLKKLAKSSFAIEKDGKYYIYTGSYSSAELAQDEKKRLSLSGVRVELQKVQLPLSLVQISAGEFSRKAEADRAAATLRRQGYNVKVATKKK